MEIRFFLPNETNGFLSNYFECEFTLNSKEWLTVEHYYQAQKFAGTKRAERVRQCKTPDRAKGYAHLRRHLWRSDWNDVKVNIMRDAVQAKFTQSRFLARELLGTGQATLIENSPNDLFWGIGTDGTGMNMLGKILMETRQILRGGQQELTESNASKDA